MKSNSMENFECNIVVLLYIQNVYIILYNFRKKFLFKKYKIFCYKTKEKKLKPVNETFVKSSVSEASPKGFTLPFYF